MLHVSVTYILYIKFIKLEKLEFGNENIISNFLKPTRTIKNS